MPDQMEDEDSEDSSLDPEPEEEYDPLANYEEYMKVRGQL